MKDDATKQGHRFGEEHFQATSHQAKQKPLTQEEQVCDVCVCVCVRVWMCCVEVFFVYTHTHPQHALTHTYTSI